MLDLQKTIATAASLRDEVQSALAVAETELPHLVCAAGALAVAVKNLEGHVAAALAKTNEPAAPEVAAAQ
jgi:hypothetical protein